MFTLFVYSVALMYTALHYNELPERGLALSPWSSGFRAENFNFQYGKVRIWHILKVNTSNRHHHHQWMEEASLSRGAQVDAADIQ